MFASIVKLFCSAFEFMQQNIFMTKNLGRIRVMSLDKYDKYAI